MAHGDHWAAFGFSSDEQIIDVLSTTWEKGVVSQQRTLSSGDPKGDIFNAAVAVEYPDSYCRSLIVMGMQADNQELHTVTAFPFVTEGTLYDFRVDEVLTFNELWEATVNGSLWEAELGFFCPYWIFEQSDWEPGDTLPIRLSALAYNLARLETTVVTIDNPDTLQKLHAAGLDGDSTNPLELDVAGGRGAFPDEQFPDDAALISVVDRVEECDFFGVPMWRLELGLFVDMSQSEEFVYRIPVHVAKSACIGGFTPAVGDSVTGTIWLQGVIAYDSM